MRSRHDASLTMWQRFIAFGFRLLYNELAWTYDAVSWLVSGGRWRQWQRSALPYLPTKGRVLEIGAGPGHLLADLVATGRQTVGLDLSRSMLRLARRRIGRQASPAQLCRGRASDLPFAAASFAAIVATFPTNYIYDPACLSELGRVLESGGRLAVVEMASLSGGDALSSSLEWLYRVTGQRGAAPDLNALLARAGIRAWRETVPLEGSTVNLVLGERVTGPAQGDEHGPRLPD